MLIIFCRNLYPKTSAQGDITRRTTRSTELELSGGIADSRSLRPEKRSGLKFADVVVIFRRHERGIDTIVTAGNLMASVAHFPKVRKCIAIHQFDAGACFV